MNTTLGANTNPKKERKQYEGIALKLLNYISAGCTQVEACKAIGCDESYASQLMAEKDFEEQVAERLSKAFKEAADIDANYINIERIASKRIADLIEHEMNVDRLARLAKFANEAKKKIAPNVQNGGMNGETPGAQSGGISVLILPTFIMEQGQREIVYNPNNEIVAIDGRQLNTFTSAGLNKLVEQKKATQEAKPKTDGKSKSVFVIKNSNDPYSDL